jgi:hypothetical protein
MIGLDDDETAEGWYRDPYDVHEERWISSGKPTSVVRDGKNEGQDDPPDRQPTRPYVLMLPDPASSAGSRDLLRADDAERQPSPDLGFYSEVAMDASIAGPTFLGDRDMMSETPYERKVRKRARNERWRARWQHWVGKKN